MVRELDFFLIRVEVRIIRDLKVFLTFAIYLSGVISNSFPKPTLTWPDYPVP